jgi:di/tripeptidase
VGGNFHTDKEWIDLTTITPRTYLLMRMIQDVAARPPKTFRPAG